MEADTKIYELELTDLYGKKHSIWGYGIDEPVDLSAVRNLFPHVPSDAFALLPKRRIDILIGINFNGLHPSGGLGVDAVDNLKALRSRFGCGWIIGGSHKLLKSSPLRFSPQAAVARSARVTVVPKIEVQDPDSVLPCSVKHGSDKLLKTFSGCVAVSKVTVDPILTPDFWDSEQMGVLPPRKCPKCKMCGLKGDCSEAHYLFTLKEENELNMISNNVNIVNGEIHVRYPFIKNPSCLPNNRHVVVRVAERLWKTLIKDGLLNTYHEEILKYIERGTFIKLDSEELSTYEGPTQYVTHHCVLKDSVTTPLRVVTNSSFDNNGNSLNSCLPKGPNSLNDMYAITLRFRCYEQV